MAEFFESSAIAGRLILKAGKTAYPWRMLALLPALIASALLVPTAKSAGAKSAAAETTVPVVRISAPVPNIDWTTTLDLASARVILNLMEGLTAFDGNGILRPALATKWTASKDQKKFTFQIRKGVLWSDGVPLTAQHFVDNFVRMLDPKVAAIAAQKWWVIKNGREFNRGQITDPKLLGVRATDDHTLVFDLAEPASFLPSVLAHTVGLPVRKDKIAAFGDKWTRPENLVVVGPYKLAEWKDEKLTLVANERYYGAKPTTKTFTFRVVQDDSTALDLFKHGSLDVLYSPPRLDWPQLRATKQMSVLPHIRVLVMGTNVTKPPMDNVKVRQALSLATDRETLAKLLNGQDKPSGDRSVFEPLPGWIPKGVPGYNPSIGLKYNPELAKQRLAEAGYPGGKGLPPIQLGTDSRDEHKLIAERLQAEWKRILGVNVEIDVRDGMTHLGRVRADPPHVFRYGIGAVYLDPELFASMFIADGSVNYPRWKNAKYDALVAKAAGAATDRARFALYDQSQRILLEDEAVLIGITQELLPVMISPRIAGFTVTPHGAPVMKTTLVQ